MMTFKTFSNDISKLGIYPWDRVYGVVVDICDKHGNFCQTLSYSSIESMNDSKNFCHVYRNYLVKRYFFDTESSMLHIKLIPSNNYIQEKKETTRVFSYHAYIYNDHDDKIDIFHYYPSVAEQFKMAINSIYGLPHISLKIENIISNDPATVVFWNDGSKTVVKAEDGDSFDLEKGILYASLKKYTNKKEYDNILRTIDLIKED